MLVKLEGGVNLARVEKMSLEIEHITDRDGETKFH